MRSMITLLQEMKMSKGHPTVSVKVHDPPAISAAITYLDRFYLVSPPQACVDIDRVEHRRILQVVGGTIVQIR